MCSVCIFLDLGPAYLRLIETSAKAPFNSPGLFVHYRMNQKFAAEDSKGWPQAKSGDLFYSTDCAVNSCLPMKREKTCLKAFVAFHTARLHFISNIMQLSESKAFYYRQHQIFFYLCEKQVSKYKGMIVDPSFALLPTFFPPDMIQNVLKDKHLQHFADASA